jgi:hypothetical protein
MRAIVLPECPEKWVCRECGKVTSEYLTAPNPFELSETLVGCPSCFEVGSLVAACWKCDREASGGYNDSGVYRYVRACHEHAP